MARLLPPIPEAFLRCFGRSARAWFVEGDPPGEFRVTGDWPPPRVPGETGDCPRDTVVETPSPLVLPVIPPERRCRGTPHCEHDLPARLLTCRRRDSPNQGRQFYTCAQERRCGLFRWLDELDQFSEMTFGATLSAAELRAQTQSVDPELQRTAWDGLRQGTSEWLAIRSCRVTASNFGTVHHTNAYARPADLLRQMLWPVHYDSCAMRYGSVNEALGPAGTHRRR